MDGEYEYKVYDTARYFVPEGMYSIGELEDLLSECKRANRIQNEALKKSMERIK